MKKRHIPYDKSEQNKAILRAFIARGVVGLTVRRAVSLGLGTELRKRISELKRDGYMFLESKQKNTSGNGTHKIWFLTGFPKDKQ